MTPYQVIGWTLLQASAVSAIVSERVWHGLRPEGDTLPCINYYEIGGLRYNGMETQPYSINCRAATAGGARALARVVITALVGTCGTGMQGTNNGFDIARMSLRADQGLIPEPEGSVYNAPIDVQLVSSVDTVS